MLNKMTLWDKILIVSFIIISIAWLGLTVLFYSSEGNKIIEIEVYGDLVERLSLTENAENTYSFTFGENTGWIKNGYETIVCMPNRIIVNIKEKNEINQGVDAIA